MSLRFLIVLILSILPGPFAGRYVHDFAQILSNETRDQVERDIVAVKQATQAEVAVVTVVSLDGMNIDEYANKLFNRWGIGTKNANNGILFITAINERRTRIEVGYGLERLITDRLSGEILDNYVIPKFKAGRFEDGIAAGSREICRILKANSEAARGVNGSLPAYISTLNVDASLFAYATGAFGLIFFLGGFLSKRSRGYSTIFIVLGILISLGLGGFSVFQILSLNTESKPFLALAAGIVPTIIAFVYNIRRYLRFGPDNCRDCGTRLTLLDETEDDLKLPAAQQLEESLGSVDYDVWVCPACLKEDVKEYTSWWSSFTECPKCNRRTYSEKRSVVTHPTRYSSGLAQLDGTCVSCKHQGSRTVVIPMITSSSSSHSSSGGGGFSGGSSGGGGASRGW